MTSVRTITKDRPEVQSAYDARIAFARRREAELKQLDPGIRARLFQFWRVVGVSNPRTMQTPELDRNANAAMQLLRERGAPLLDAVIKMLQLGYRPADYAHPVTRLYRLNKEWRSMFPSGVTVESARALVEFYVTAKGAPPPRLADLDAASELVRAMGLPSASRFLRWVARASCSPLSQVWAQFGELLAVYAATEGEGEAA